MCLWKRGSEVWSCNVLWVFRAWLRWWGVVDWDGLGMWNVRVEMIGCQCINVVVAGVKCAGRGRKTWRGCVKDDMDELGLHPEWAVFRDIRRDFISGQTSDSSWAGKKWTFLKQMMMMRNNSWLIMGKKRYRDETLMIYKGNPFLCCSCIIIWSLGYFSQFCQVEFHEISDRQRRSASETLCADNWTERKFKVWLQGHAPQWNLPPHVLPGAHDHSDVAGSCPMKPSPHVLPVALSSIWWSDPRHLWHGKHIKHHLFHEADQIFITAIMPSHYSFQHSGYAMIARLVYSTNAALICSLFMTSFPFR